MEKFIHRENPALFKKRLADVRDESERQVLFVRLTCVRYAIARRSPNGCLQRLALLVPARGEAFTLLGARRSVRGERAARGHQNDGGNAESLPQC